LLIVEQQTNTLWKTIPDKMRYALRFSIRPSHAIPKILCKQWFASSGAEKFLSTSSVIPSFHVNNPGFRITPALANFSKEINRNQSAYALQQMRFKNKRAKVGKHKETLEALAYQHEHEEAKAKREKRKAKDAARKDKHHQHSPTEESEEEYEHPPEEDYSHDQNVLPDLKQVDERMKELIDNYKDYLNTIRGGQPTPELFENLMVMNAYGDGHGASPLKAYAQVVISSPTLATVTCYDPVTAKAVSNTIRDYLELNPQVEGGEITVPMPRVSLETRQKTAHNVSKRTEMYRARIRKARQAAMDVIKKGVAGKLEGISKDDAFRNQKELEDLTQKRISELNALAEKKQAEIMEV
jgi:ribosome recycling factor